MRSNVFQDAVESSAKVFGRKSDVRVIFEGSKAHTNGNDIVLPALPASVEITIDQQDVIRGFRDHESMHVRCTDASKKGLDRLTEMTQRSKGLGALVQFCEDVRIENAGCQAYPGMKHTLSATNKHGAKMMLSQIESKGRAEDVLVTIPKPIQFRLVLQQVGRSLIGVESDGIFDKMSDVIKAHDPALYALAEQYGKRMAKLPTGYRNNALSEAVSKRGTHDAMDLAEEIYAAYGKHEEDAAPPPPPPEQPPAEQPPKEVEQQPKDDTPEPQQDGAQGQPDGSDGDGQEDDKDDGTRGSGDSDSEDQGDGGDSDSEDQGDGDDSDGDTGGDGQADEPPQDDDQGGGDGGDDGDDIQPGDSSGGEMGDEDGGDSGQDHGGSAQQDDSTPSDDTPDDVGSTGHGNGMDEDVQDDFNVDDLRNQALSDVVQDINNGPDVGKGRAVSRGIFGVWSSRFSIKLPIDEAIFQAHNVSTSNPNGRTYLRSEANKLMVLMDKELSGKKAMVRRILELELQARNDRKWNSGFKSGRLQSVRLVQALQGRETVYQKREDGKDMDTLLHISIDGSGSMTDYGRAYAALTLAYALSEALERTGCDISVEMWGSKVIGKGSCPASTYTLREYQDALNKAECDIYERRKDPLNVAKYVSFGVLTRGVLKTKRQRTTDPEVRQGFGLAVRSLNCSTPSYHAVFADLKDMGRENHSKKIYLHITDGDADATLEGQDGREIMKEAHSYADAIGVHMIGVGITGMKVSHLFRDSIEVGGPDAYEPVIRKLAKLVAQEAGHATNFKRSA